MNIIKIISDPYAEYKDESEYFHNVVFVLSIACIDNQKCSDDVVDNKILDKFLNNLIVMKNIRK